MTSMRDSSPGRQTLTPSSSAPAPGPGSSSRERAAHAVDFYNSHVLRARLQAGLVSYHHHNQPQPQSQPQSHGQYVRRQLYQPHVNEPLYRSNSSLELQEHHQYQHHGHMHPHSHRHHPHQVPAPSPSLRREYGSHGSINALGDARPSPIVGVSGNGTTSESFFAMLQDYRPATLVAADQRSPGPTEYLRVQAEAPPTQPTPSATVLDGAPVVDNTPPVRQTSPKLKHRLQRLLGHGGGSGSGNNTSSSNSTSGKSLKNCTSASNDDIGTSAVASDADERQRRRCFAHYDCQSMATNLSYSALLTEQLAERRRNTTTGASAASMPNTRSSTPNGEGDADVEDPGDGVSNELVDSCPFFRNEVGGEEERTVSMTRHAWNRPLAQRPVHQPALAYGFAILDFLPPDTHWKHGTCPYQKLPRPVETIDEGAMFYRNHFMAKEHQNFFGTDDHLGPVAISIKRERINEGKKNSNNGHYQYRLIIRTSELLTLRGTVLEESIPHLRVSSSGKISYGTREVLEYISPEIQLSCLRLGIASPNVEQVIATLDEQGLSTQYKVGIMYCRAGQGTEEDMYNNETAGPAFVEFLSCIGETVRLLGFQKYKAGLDSKSDSTGMYSVYSEYKNNEIMFHVSTMLPHSPNNRQQLLRKRHVGNDIVTIVFQEPGSLPFTPRTIRSQFQHVFIVVRAINPCTENTHYKVAVSRSKDVPLFGPPIKDGAVYPKSKTFADFLLAKVVNAENAAHQSEKFATMARRTRLEYIKDLINNHCTNTGLESGQKFAFFNKQKKEKLKPIITYDRRLTGAICWQVLVDDNGLAERVDAFLGISTDSLVLIEENSRQIIFVAPCTSILGWSVQTNSLKIYHHQGESFTIHIRETYFERDELMEIVGRLRAVTNGTVTQELILRRKISCNLGFHVQPDGLVTHVETSSSAEQSGLKKGARLVEVCKIALPTLSHEAMVDFLKTSETVTISIIPAQAEGEARKGCPLSSCRYLVGQVENDYENVNNDEMNRGQQRANAQLQQPVARNQPRRHERHHSPPRPSSSSSGYGTGSSSRSFLFPDHRFPVYPEGTMTSSSSGQSNEERWYEFLESHELGAAAAATPPPPPPPLPARAPQGPEDGLIPPQHRHPVDTHSFDAATIMHQHNRVHVSHSLPLPLANFSLPLSATTTSGKTSMHDLMVTSAPQEDSRANDGHSTDASSSSDKMMLPVTNGHVSPRRQTKLRSNNHTRNQSPRTTQSETRLRPGVSSRSNRNSANLSASTLQEDLMKLINPDYIPDMEQQQPIASGSQATGARPKQRNAKPKQQQQHQQAEEVIFTTARPATVISNASTTSSPAPCDFKISNSKEELLATTNTTAPEPIPLPLPDAGDWTSLVDTATRVMQQQVPNVDLEPNTIRPPRFQCEERWMNGMDIKESTPSAMGSSSSVPELQTHVSALESRVTLEQRRRKSLEDEIKRLREENRRLQDESQAAAHQLRRFTEWFFQTIERQ